MTQAEITQIIIEILLSSAIMGAFVGLVLAFFGKRN